MLKNEEFALACRRRYAEEGLIVDERNGEFAHCPLPRGQGEAGYYLLHDDHQHQGLLQSRDLEKKCFFGGDVLLWLRTVDPLPEGYFDLWDIYEEYGKGRATYRNQDTGETAYLTPKEAAELSWVHVDTGKSIYLDPMSGETAKLDTNEAKERGWVGVTVGKAPYRNPETGETACLTPEEAIERGWLHPLKGVRVCRDPETGRTAALTAEEATSKGWLGVNAGRRFPRVPCPHCGKAVSSNRLCVHKRACESRKKQKEGYGSIL